MGISNWFVRILFSIFFTPTFAFSAETCRSLFSAEIVKVFIADSTYQKDIKNLRSTLSGKLATVWRSEWKTKLSVSESNQYVNDLVNKFLTTHTRSVILSGLDINNDGFTREVHSRLYKLQVEKLLLPADELAVRDSPAPEGAKDTTFTYYLKPLKSFKSEGKHQVRIRTYLREIRYAEISIGESVQGFDINEKKITVTRLSNNNFKLTMGIADVVEIEQRLTIDELTTKEGPSMRLFAPHGKNFKLEIKSALTDHISGSQYPLLAGKHMVQKLDVSLSAKQVGHLFAPLQANSSENKIKESNLRIASLTAELIAKTPDNKARIEAVFEVLLQGISKNSNFLTVEGATAYHRTAFETTTGLQTTIDRDQGVYEGNMYGENFLKNPLYTIQTNKLIKTKTKDARHVELKVPVTSMQQSVGIDYADPAAAPQPRNANFNSRIKEMIAIYHHFVKNVFHAGKFNYIRENGELEH